MKKLMFLLVFIFMISSVSAIGWSNNTFNNSLTEEFLSFAATGQYLRYLSVPENVVLTLGNFNITYPFGGGVPAANVENYYTTESVKEERYGIYNLSNNEGSVTYNNSNCKIGDCSQLYVNNNLEVASASAMNFNESYTFNIWLRLADIPTNGNEFAVMARDVSAAGRITVFNQTTTGNAVWLWNSFMSAGSNTVSSNTPWVEGSYFMLTVTRNDSTGNVSGYINAGFEVSGTTGNANLTSPDKVQFGTEHNDNLDFVGQLDEIGYWNVTLSQTEITELYNSGDGITYDNFPTSGLVINVSIGGSDGVQNLSISNLSSSSNLTTALTNTHLYINNYLSTCTYVGGICLVPFVFGGSVGNGWIEYKFLDFSNLGINENSQTYNTTSYETASETFTINVTFDSNEYTTSTANLVYAGTSYSGTKSDHGSSVIFNRNLQLPSADSEKNNSFYWELSLTNATGINLFNSTEFNQTVSNINFSICGGPGGNNAFINFSFKNETTDQQVINASVEESNFTFWLGNGGVKKSYTFANSTVQQSYGFCFTPADRTLNTDLTISYKNGYTQQRTFAPDTLSLTNVTTNQTLFLLPTGDGIFVTFQIINNAEQPIEGAEITITRSGFGTVTQVTTGSSGTASIFLNPNFAYTLSVSKTGFTTFSATQTFPTTEFTVILGASTSATNVSALRGVTWHTEPRQAILVNNTNYTFNFTMASTFWNLDDWGFVLFNETGSALGSTSTTSLTTGGTIGINANTVNNRIVYMDWYYTVNGTEVNGTRRWGVDVPAEGSLVGFFQRFKTYMEGGLLGSGGTENDNNSKFNFGLVIFFAMFISIGILSFKFGLNSPEALMLIAVFVVAVFDLGFGMINFGNGAITGFPTFFAALVFVILFLRRNQ